MNTYLVGGAVRDLLLGIKPKDKDWVVVGATENQMIEAGFKKINASFPVFIDPKTNQEYALARSENKVAGGYHGFKVNFSEHTSLEDDLKRRDLTINSMAMDKARSLIDPFNGEKDIKNRILRHTSPAFVEDPLRVIRLARFKAQLSDYNFSIASELKELIKKVISSGELAYLTKERLHKEFLKALNNPSIFFKTLNDISVLKVVFPTIKTSIKDFPDAFFFEKKTYREASEEQKVTLALLHTPKDSINLLKKELCLNNHQFKLLLASINIKIILETIVDAKTTYELLREANLIRNIQLFKNTITLYKKYLSIAKLKQFEAPCLKLEKTVFNLTKLNVQELLVKTPKNKLKDTINGLYIDTIKMQLKI